MFIDKFNTMLLFPNLKDVDIVLNFFYKYFFCKAFSHFQIFPNPSFFMTSSSFGIPPDSLSNLLHLSIYADF